MSKARKNKAFANVTLWIILIGAIVFISGFGISLHIAQKEVTSEVDRKVQRDIDYLNAYIDGNLQRIEDAGYSLSSLMFGDVVRDESGRKYINLNNTDLRSKHTPDQIYEDLEKFMRATPIICGIAIEYEPYVYPEIKSKYGFTPYVTNVSGSYEHLDLGEMTNSFEWEWYTEPLKNRDGHWNDPFQDSSIGHVIAVYSIPVFRNGEPYAVIAVDIDTEAISNKCAEISPYPGAQVFLLDQDFNFISHPDKSFLMKNVSELEGVAYSDVDEEMKEQMESGLAGKSHIRFEGNDFMMYFSPVIRSDWTITIQCPETEVYGGVERMKRSTSLISLLSILVMSLMLVLVFRRFQSISVKEAGIEKELNVAHGIQAGMLPMSFRTPEIGKILDVFGFQKPAKSVGGDLYDYFILGNKFYFCMGDVSGKGVPASLYMVVILALFRNIARKESDPGKIAFDLNNSLISSNNASMFCTMFFGILDLETLKLEFCNAGHNRPIVYKSRSNESMYVDVKSNMVLGIMDDFPYVSEEISLEPGDSVFLYTDGLTEAENEEKVLFGDDAALAAFSEGIGKGDAEQNVNSILDSVLAHTDKAEQNDDITMLMVRIKN